MNILITSCSKKVLLVKSIKTYLNNMGGLLYTTDINVNSPALYFSDDYFLCPRSNDPKFIDFLIDRCNKFNIRLIIPTSDRELKLFSENKHKFDECNCKVMVCNKNTLELCQNKKKFVDFCLNEGFNVPTTYSTIDEIKKFPIFIKPIIGSAGEDIKKINNVKELANVDFKKFIVQEFIDWKEYTIDYLADFDGKYKNCVPRERIKVVNGESCVSQIYDNNIIKENCKLLGNKLKLIGHNTIQCFFNGKEIKFIEINPRFGGAANLGIVSGLNSPKFIIDLLYKKDFIVNPIKKNLIMLRYSTDIFGYMEDGNFISKILKEKDKIFCIDIDGTICSENCEYHLAKPIIKVIDKINKLYENNRIILFTSRGYTSKKDWRELTENQLKLWNLKYHELHFGKPFADYYIDNKAKDILDWI